MREFSRSVNQRKILPGLVGPKSAIHLRKGVLIAARMETQIKHD